MFFLPCSLCSTLIFFLSGALIASEVYKVRTGPGQLIQHCNRQER